MRLALLVLALVASAAEAQERTFPGGQRPRLPLSSAKSVKLFTSPQSTVGGGTYVDSLGGAITSQRASTVSCRGADGVSLTTVSANVICVEPEGVLNERGVTNKLLRNSELDNASIWVPAGSTATAPVVTANATPSPLSGGGAAERVDFPAVTSGYSILYQGVSGVSGAHTFSVYAKAVSGTPTFYLSYENGVTWFSATCSPNTTTWTRCELRMPSPVTSGVVQFGVDIRGSSTETAKAASSVYLTLAQLEARHVATSPIPTAGTQVARADATMTVTKPDWLTSTAPACIRYCLTPKWTGAPDTAGYPLNSNFGYHNADLSLNSYNGSGVVSVALGPTVAGPVAGTKSCFRMDWGPTSRTFYNPATGQSSSGAALDSGNFTFSGWGLFSGWLSDVAFYSKAGKCL